MHALESKTAEVENLSIERDHARFDLHKGKIQLLSEVNERSVAVLFKGEGTWHFSPPTAIERNQLLRFYDTDSLVKSFNTLLILFNDSTLAELQKKICLWKWNRN